MLKYALLAASVTASAMADCPPYRIVDLGTFGEAESVAYSINDTGEVVGGYGQSSTSHFPFYWHNGSMIPLDRPGLVSTDPISINEAGDISGWASPGLPQAVYWRRTGGGSWAVTPLGNGWGNSINESLQIVGATSVEGQRACAWQDGAFTDLGIPAGGLTSLAWANNNSGIVVGRVQATASGTFHPVIWESGTPTVLDTIIGEAFDVNENGQVVGTNFVWQNGAISDLPFEGVAINDRGDVISRFGDLYSNGLRLNLNDHLPSNSGWHIVQTLEINDAGQIVGWGYLDGGANRRAFLLNPPDCYGDLSENGVVDLVDLTVLLACFGSEPCGDLDCDNDTDLADLTRLLSNFGRHCQ